MVDAEMPERRLGGEEIETGANIEEAGKDGMSENGFYGALRRQAINKGPGPRR